MAAAIGLRDDYDAGALRAAARRSKDGRQARRLLVLAAIYDASPILREMSIPNNRFGMGRRDAVFLFESASRRATR